MGMAEIPAEWARLMVKAGAVDPRYGNASIVQLGKMAGAHTSTVSKLVLRGERISPEKMIAVARVLGIPVEALPVEPAAEVYTGPPGSEGLSGRERRAVDEVIRLLINRKAESSESSSEEKTSDAGDARVGEKTPDLGSRVAFDLAASREPGVKRIDPRKGRKTQS